jgi:hypothetical protein
LAEYARPGNTGVRLYVPLDADGKNWKPTIIDGDAMACESMFG